MEEDIPRIRLYGFRGQPSARRFRELLEERRLPYEFSKDGRNQGSVEELLQLSDRVENLGPTVTIGKNILRDPSERELVRWLDNLVYSNLIVSHDTEGGQYIMEIYGERARIEYVLKDGKMYLVHSEVPEAQRGKGLGRILVEKTFEKLLEEGHRAVAVCTYIRWVRNLEERWYNNIE